MTLRRGDRVIYQGRQWVVAHMHPSGAVELIDDDHSRRIARVSNIDAVLDDVAPATVRPSYAQAPLIGGHDD